MKSFFSSFGTGRGRVYARGQKVTRGQSLVELALTMPVLLLIVAGTMEVTNLLTLYNEVQLAAREGARFASQGGPDNTVMNVITQSVQLTPVTPTDPQMNVWIARPVLAVGNMPCTNACTYSWSSYTDNCIFPVNSSGVGTCTNTDPITSAKVLSDLTAIKNDSMNGERMVVVVIRYEAQTILNLRVFGTTNGRFPVYAYAVMRQEVSQLASNQLTSGCSAYPIALDDAAASPVENSLSTITINSLPGGNRTGFGFLSWRLGAQDAVNTAVYAASSPFRGSLWFPGNSQNGTHGYSYTTTAPNTTQLVRGNIVYSNPATIADANTGGTSGPLYEKEVVKGTDPLTDMSKPLAIRVITYTRSASNPSTSSVGSPYTNIYTYTIGGFAIVRIKSHTATQLTFQWVSWDSSCGFPAN